MAVGRREFVEATKKLGIKAKGRKMFGNNETYQLLKPDEPYGAISMLKMVF